MAHAMAKGGRGKRDSQNLVAALAQDGLGPGGIARLLKEEGFKKARICQLLKKLKAEEDDHRTEIRLLSKARIAWDGQEKAYKLAIPVGKKSKHAEEKGEEAAGEQAGEAGGEAGGQAAEAEQQGAMMIYVCIYIFFFYISSNMQIYKYERHLFHFLLLQLLKRRCQGTSTAAAGPRETEREALSMSLSLSCSRADRADRQVAF